MFVMASVQGENQTGDLYFLVLSLFTWYQPNVLFTYSI